MTNKVLLILFVFLFAFTPGVSALNVMDTVLQDVWDSTGQSIRISYVSSESGWDVAEETALTNTVHPLVTFTHTTSDTPANGIGLSLDWYQETSAANTELGARIAAVTTDVTAASEDFKFDWMLMTAGAAPTTKMSLGSTGVLTLVNAATLDNATNGTLTITEPIIAIAGDQTVTGSVDIAGAAGLILSNDETITNAVNGTVLVTATTLATSGALDVTGGGITLQNDESISNSTNGQVDIVGNFGIIAGTSGGLVLKAAEATATLSGATTDIDINIPASVVIVGCQLRVDTAVTSGDGATSWGAVYKTGATATIATGQAFTKNTKVNTFFDANGATAITSNITDITIAPNANTFSGGVIRAIVYYYQFAAMADAA